MVQLFVGLMAEGATDYRFLKPVIEKTFLEILFNEMNKDVEILVFEVEYQKDGGFPDYVFHASKYGFEKYGIMSLVIHTDADDLKADHTYKTKIQPAVNFVNSHTDAELCKELVAIVPVYETESWMLANKELIKKYIGTDMTDAQLNIDGHPESFRNPKEKIEEAIRIGRQDLPKKIRDKVTIHDLYSILGESMDVRDIEKFVSYKDFVNNIKTMLTNLNFLHS
jgi:hypothetical protein